MSSVWGKVLILGGQYLLPLSVCWEQYVSVGWLPIILKPNKTCFDTSPTSQLIRPVASWDFREPASLIYRPQGIFWPQWLGHVLLKLRGPWWATRGPWSTRGRGKALKLSTERPHLVLGCAKFPSRHWWQALVPSLCPACWGIRCTYWAWKANCPPRRKHLGNCLKTNTEARILMRGGNAWETTRKQLDSCQDSTLRKAAWSSWCGDHGS